METEKLYEGKRIVEEKEKTESDINLIDYLLAQEGRDDFSFTSKLTGETELHLTREELLQIKASREVTFGELEQEFLDL